MDTSRSHQPLMRFIKKIMDVASGYTKQDLVEFRSVASRNYPALLPLMEEYIRLAEQADTGVEIAKPGQGRNSSKIRNPESGAMHLFDLLRDKRLFSQNSDLATFAERIVPNVPSGRFGKISRVEIAARIIEYLETLPKNTKDRLEASMREALKPGEKRVADKRSFLSKWEKIIKGIEL